MSVTAQSLLVANRLGKGLAKGNANVFNGVVGIDVQIAACFDLQVEHAVAGNLIEHVIEKSDSRSQFGPTCSVEIEFNANLSFQGFSGDFHLPHDHVLCEKTQRYAKTREKTMGTCRSVVFFTTVGLRLLPSWLPSPTIPDFP